MSRWRRVVRRELLRYREETGYDHVELGDLYEQTTPVLRREFPNNDNPRAKLRQILQQLRDRGEVEFLGAGVYRISAVDPSTAATEGASADSREYTASVYETTVGARSVPRAFRIAVLDRYGGVCPVSGVDHDRLLDVAHVLPWGEYPEHRTEVTNVLPLSKTFHAAFDAGLFTIDTSYRLRVSPTFETSSSRLRRLLCDSDGERLPIPDGTLSPSFLDRHNRTLDWL